MCGSQNDSGVGWWTSDPTGRAVRETRIQRRYSDPGVTRDGKVVGTTVSRDREVPHPTTPWNGRISDLNGDVTLDVGPRTQRNGGRRVLNLSATRQGTEFWTRRHRKMERSLVSTEIRHELEDLGLQENVGW